MKISQLGTIASVNVWLAIVVLAGILATYEIAAILTHRFHTISWYAAHNRWLAWVIGFAFLISGIGLFLWFVFWHTKHYVPW